MPGQDSLLDPKLISICIPTYQRPALLAVALASAAAQRYPRVEIVIGDDSLDDASERVVLRHIAAQSARAAHVVRYERHRPSLGQAGNVNRLFARARGARLVLLHDDDVLEPDALQVLAACWAETPALTAAFGKQWIIDHGGVVQPAASLELNRRYRRVESNAGLLPTPALAGIWQMFPNDAYMVDTLAARATGYRTDNEVGPACDFDFGLRLCLTATAIHFVDRELARYRITDESVSSRSFPSMFSYRVLRDTSVPVPPSVSASVSATVRQERADALANLAPPAASALSRSGRPREALAVMASEDYRWRDRLSARGVYHLWLALRAWRRPGQLVG